MSDEQKPKLGDQEAAALRDAIQQIQETQRLVQLSAVNDSLARINRLLAVVQV